MNLHLPSVLDTFQQYYDIIENRGNQAPAIHDNTKRENAAKA